MNIEWVTDPNAWVAFLTLTALEIVLGVDNVVFISIPAGRLSFGAVIAQILLLDIVFSLDSVITAVGMADDIGLLRGNGYAGSWRKVGKRHRVFVLHRWSG